jgi:hypothetical protein
VHSGGFVSGVLASNLKIQSFDIESVLPSNHSFAVETKHFLGFESLIPFSLLKQLLKHNSLCTEFGQGPNSTTLSSQLINQNQLITVPVKKCEMELVKNAG